MTGGVKVRIMAAVFAVSVGVGTFAVPASASTGAKLSKSDCEAIANIGDETPDVSSSSKSFDPKELAAASTGFEETAKKVKNKKLKKALKRLAGYYDDMAGADNVAEAVAITLKAGKKWAKAFGTFTKAAAECVFTNVTLPSDVTLPSGITLPSGVTLPSGITLPR